MTTVVPLETGKDLGSRLAEKYGWNIIFPDMKQFPDGETFLRISDYSPDDTIIVQSLYHPQEIHLFNLLNLSRTLHRKGAKSITAITPYLCYARADREIKGGEAISIETVFTLLHAVGITKILVIDLHNPMVSTLAPSQLEIHNILPSKSMAQYVTEIDSIDDDWLVLAPDSGAKLRAKALAAELNLDYNYFHKHRDPDTGEVHLLGEAGLSTIKANAIIVDDIMTTGNSLLQVINHLKMQDVQKIHVLISHVFGTDNVDQMVEAGRGTVAGTVSVPSPISKIDILPDLVDFFDRQL